MGVEADGEGGVGGSVVGGFLLQSLTIHRQVDEISSRFVTALFLVRWIRYCTMAMWYWLLMRRGPRDDDAD